MRAIALAILLLGMRSRSRQEYEEMSPSEQGFMGWVAGLSFIGFWFCLIGGW